MFRTFWRNSASSRVRASPTPARAGYPTAGWFRPWAEAYTRADPYNLPRLEVARMNIAFDGDGHVRTALGLYFMGGLTDEEESAVERHLAGCDRCLSEYDSAGDAVSYLR